MGNEPWNPQIFREYDIRGEVERDFTPEVLDRLAAAVGTYFHRRGCREVAMGRDVRPSSPRLRDSLAAGLAAAGLEVRDLGVVPTPALYCAILDLPADAGVMVTGSHNPPAYNGIKLQVGPEPVFGAAIQEIRRLGEAEDFATGGGKIVEIAAFLDRYRHFLRERLRPPGRHLRVVVDSGNGVAGLVAPDLYRSLGYDVVELFSEPDGSFPHHHPDPTVAANLTDLQAAVLREGADLGLAFDGDADRVGAVDERGRILWGDELLILFSRAVLQERPGATIVGDVKCTDRWAVDVERRGGRALWNATGHALLKDRLRRERAALAGEWSGHFCFADRFPGFDDGIYAGGRLLEIVAAGERPLSSMLDDLPPAVGVPEIRLDCPDDKKFAVVDAVRKRLAGRYDTILLDGVRVSYPEGWALVRASNTQPALVLRFEARNEASLRRIREEVEGLLGELMRAP
ncbi:MAG: phosphomannomutase/phosphoglucomutase [Acidobacteriota bacterium]